MNHHTSNDKEERRNKSNNKNLNINLQCVYECLGAPVLLYRSLEDRYSLLDEQPQLDSSSVSSSEAVFLEEFQRLRRCQARWYYPIDFHLVRQEMTPYSDGFPFPTSRAATDEDIVDWDDVVDWEYHKKHSFPLLQEARAHLLLSGSIDASDEEQQNREEMLRAQLRFDRSWVKEEEYYPGRLFGRRLAQLYDQERIDFSDPAYMAPIPCQALEYCQEETIEKTNYNRHRQPLASPLDHPNGPQFYGNLFVTFSCSCRLCCSAASPSWLLLHPCGPLLEEVCLSRLWFPLDSSSSSSSLRVESGCPSRLDADDTIRQLAQCGDKTFVARTSIHCVVFSVRFPPSLIPETVCQTGELTLLHRIDLRQLASTTPYYRPSFIASHPRYGNAWTDPKIAVLLEEASSPHQRNVILHVNAGATTSSLRQTRHTISNLQDISKIDFSTNHPMVLWSAARPYVRPGLARQHMGLHPDVGHGYSLYSIDLRSEKAAFQWSPSGEEYEIEGTHSISGIFTDWNVDHSLWVASVSAGKTWEIDTRMPCRSVNSWSLPHACDDSGALLPATGMYGAGSIFTQPWRDPGVTGDNSPRPMFSVALNPGAFGIHIYQRPLSRPRFQTKNLESASCPGLAFLGNMSVAASSVLALPDVSDRVFTCGLASLCIPVTRFLDSEAIISLGYLEDDLTSVVCLLSMTSKGDIYCHSSLESRASYQRGKSHDGLPVGASSAEAVEIAHKSPSSTSDTQKSRLGNLCIALSNQYPVPSAAVAPSFATPVNNMPNLPLESDLSRGFEEGERPARSTTTVKPLASTSAFVVRKRRGNETLAEMPELHPILLDSVALSVSIEHEPEPTINRFDHQSARIVVKKDEGQYRSDVTSSFMDKAAQAWPDLNAGKKNDDTGR